MNEGQVTAMVFLLAHYLRTHPFASDSASGIAQWWLPPAEVSMEVLECALEWLKQQGAIEESAGADGRTRFRRCGNDQALDAAVAARAGLEPWQTH
jgi:hypothetical protein